jgi:tetratricopeptide (TPR) repeat protein
MRFWEVYNRATNLMRGGEWSEAADGYREALAIDPRHEDGLYYLGNVLFELSRYDDAVAAWRRLTRVNPLSTRAHLQLGAIHSCGAEGAPFDLEVAEREFQRALEINKEETGPVLKLGEVCLLAGQDQRALSYLNTALQSNAKSVEAHYLIGYVEWRRGERGRALDALRDAVASSKIKRPKAQPLGEGDTRGGKGPILAEGAGRKSFFAANWSALRSWEDEQVSTERMEAEYHDLDARLRILLGTDGGR